MGREGRWPFYAHSGRDKNFSPIFDKKTCDFSNGIKTKGTGKQKSNFTSFITFRVLKFTDTKRRRTKIIIDWQIVKLVWLIT